MVSPRFLFQSLLPFLRETRRVFRALVYDGEIMEVENRVARLFRLCLEIARNIGECGVIPSCLRDGDFLPKFSNADRGRRTLPKNPPLNISRDLLWLYKLRKPFNRQEESIC